MSTAAYASFDLLVDRGPPPAGYRARVIQAPAGEAVADFELPFSATELTDFLSRLGGAARDAGAAPAETASALEPRTFGARLYDAVFAGPVGLCWRRSLAEAERRGVGLRLRLRLTADVLDLAELPWEFLFDPDLNRFLALSDLTPIVRYIELDRPGQPLRARLPLTVLAVVASPSDAVPLAVEREWQNLQAALDPLLQSGALVLERLASATLPALQDRLRRGPVDLLHFVGHGFFDRQSNTGGLVFEDARGRTAVVTAETLGLLLHDHAALRLIFLNACQAAQGGRSDPFAGLAQRLVRQGAPAVLAMQFPVSDDAAGALAQAFYQALADGLPADTALSQARKALAARGNAQEWATPVLFSRSDDNRLFDLLDVLPAPACPYPGMVPFRAEDARFFYGREDEIEHVLRHLRHQRLLFVIGPSGSGKSSLLAAGVLPKLARSAHFPPDYWLVRTLRPGSRPREALGAALQGDVSQPAEAIAQLLAANAPAQRLLLVIDQFEELFSLADADQRQEFMACFQALRGVEPCALVAAMRADFYPDLMNSDLWPVDASQRLEVAALRGDALRRAIRQPADQVEVEVEDALVERLLADAAGEPGALPMLQETLQLLWARMRRRRITPEDYDRLGDGQRSGLTVAIATKADATLAEFTPDEQGVARRLFLRLIQFGQGRLDTRRQLPEAELRSASRDPATFDRVLTQLAGSRLLTLSGGEGGAARLVDIAHERLITEWPRLGEWVKQHKAAELMRRRLEDKAQEWVRLGRGAGGLLDQAELAEAGAWLADAGAAELGASADLLALVATSRKAINPGWHRWGTAGMLLGVTSLATLVAWIYLMLEFANLQGIGRAAVILFLVSLGVLLALAIWRALRSSPYMPQRLSQTVAAKRPFQVTIGFLAVITAVLWAGLGVSTWRLAVECDRLGYSWNSSVSGIAVINGGIGESEASFFRLALHNAVDDPDMVKVALVDEGDANTCRARFQYRVTLNGPKDATQQEAIYTAEITPVPAGKSLLGRPGTGCGEIFVLASETAVALGYSLAVADDCLISGPSTCEPWYLNEEAYALYRAGNLAGAESKFKAIIDRYPHFAWAHHNLGMTQLKRCSDPGQAAAELRTAVTLGNGACGWFWYDLASACYAAGDHVCALEAAQEASSADPESADAYNAMAVILRELGRFDESATMLDAYADHLSEQSPLEAQVALDKNRGILEFRRGQLGEARRLLESADRSLKRINLVRSIVADQPLAFEEEIVFYLARIHDTQGDSAKARDYWCRYSLLPQSCAAGEEERRKYATNQLSLLTCRP